MATKSQKEESLKAAIEITKEFGRGGTALHPEIALKRVYDKLNEIKDEIEKTKD